MLEIRWDFEFHNVAAQAGSWLPRNSRGQPEPLTGRASLPRDMTFRDNRGGSTLLFGKWLGEHDWASPDSFGAVLGPPDGRTWLCWTAGCVSVVLQLPCLIQGYESAEFITEL